MNNNEFYDIPFARPYRITERSLDNIKESLAKELNCRFEEINVYFDPKKGYYFYGPYDICVADLIFERSEYRGVQLYGGVIADLREQLEEERIRLEQEDKRRRIEQRKLERELERKKKRNRKIKYVLQKYVAPGVLLTAGGIAVLSGIGAIHNALVEEPPAIVQQIPSRNTVANANDLILYRWANYAMGQVSDIAYNSSYEQVATFAEQMRVDYFTPVMSSYYGYMDNLSLGLPTELVGDSVKNAHNAFRNSAYLFDEALEEHNFGNCVFGESPYANAIVVDANGLIIEGSSQSLFGEVYDSYGQLLSVDNTDSYTIYVRAQDIIGNDYGTSNYPTDAIMYEGVAYVSDSHLYDFDAPNVGTVSK